MKKRRKIKRTNWKILIASLIIVYLVAFVGSMFTSQGVDSEWYEQIKPNITPPDYVFPIVWNILFFLIALSLYFAYTSAKSKKLRNKIMLVFGINFLLNILWSLFYFTLKNPAAAFIGLILLWLSILAMIYTTHRINKLSTYLLVPYLLWVSFAGILNWLSAF